MTNHNTKGQTAIEKSNLESEVLRLWNIYQYLGENDLCALSHTSLLLHDGNSEYMLFRLSEELGELAGVLDGTHVHSDLPDDIVFEAHQVCYWLYLLSLTLGITYEQLLAPVYLSRGAAAETGYRNIQAEQVRAISLRLLGYDYEILLPVLQEILYLIGLCCTACSVDVRQVLKLDLNEMEGRSYLAPYLNILKREENT